MTKEEFDTLNDFILANIKIENPFIITTSRLFKVINCDIQFTSGHKKLYNDFVKYCEEFPTAYNVNSHLYPEGSDKQFDIEFRQL